MLILFFLLLFMVGWIWTVILGFKESVLWGILNLLFPPISTIVFAIKHRTAFVPTLLVLFGSPVFPLLLYMSSMPSGVQLK